MVQEDRMKLELLRLSGQPVCKDLWRSAPDISVDYVDEIVKDELLSFYDGNDRAFWPKPQYGQWAPEVVKIVEDDGELLTKYDINDLAEDTGRKLVPPLAPAKPIDGPAADGGSR
ncbi:MAG TPA: hypothetical protein VKQ09_07255 [Sphingomonas sp.]|nr:hypothetical protein [Sphingomonas sp.]